MDQINKKITIEEIVKQLSVADLQGFIIKYAAKHPEFEKVFIGAFNPKKPAAGKEEYIAHIKDAFMGSEPPSRNRYRDYGDYGFDAVEVAGDLEPLLEKADYYIRHANYEEAILICKSLIETIPNEWEADFDYDGDVQVIYDRAIDKLQLLLEQNTLSPALKKELFNWYSNEHKNTKHEYVGLNTDLKALEQFFRDTPEMLQQNIANMEERIKNSGNEYDRQRAAIAKIRLLQNAGMENEAEAAISQYIHFSNVRKLRLEKLLDEKNYQEAINVIHGGIEVARQQNHFGTLTDWKDELLNIYLQQNDTGKIISTAADLFINGRNRRKYYDVLKQNITQSDWPAALLRLLNELGNKDNAFKAEILIEHQMWDKLFDLCKGNAESIEQYEKYLKPHYAKDILAAYHNYVEKQALITDQRSYENVARVLAKMKKYEGGKELVQSLVQKYRAVYKRRKNMIAALKDI
ncbi:MAG: hypothetical protein WKG06_39465 [Segetibacter sp.]